MIPRNGRTRCMCVKKKRSVAAFGLVSLIYSFILAGFTIFEQENGSLGHYMTGIDEQSEETTDVTILAAKKYWQHQQEIRKVLLSLLQVSAIALAVSVGFLLQGLVRDQRKWFIPYLACVCFVKITGLAYTVFDVKDSGFGSDNYVQWLLIACFLIIHMYALRTVIVYFNNVRPENRERERQTSGIDNTVMMHFSGHADDPLPPINLRLPSYDEAIKVLPKCPDYSETNSPEFSERVFSPSSNSAPMSASFWHLGLSVTSLNQASPQLRAAERVSSASYQPTPADGVYSISYQLAMRGECSVSQQPTGVVSSSPQPATGECLTSQHPTSVGAYANSQRQTTVVSLTRHPSTGGSSTSPQQRTEEAC